MLTDIDYFLYSQVSVSKHCCLEVLPASSVVIEDEQGEHLEEAGSEEKYPLGQCSQLG